MEVEDMQLSKFPKISNGRNDASQNGGQDGAIVKRAALNGGAAADSANRLHGWHHSSRIIRVSRASGGKDRHSKVWTSKGPRDRRVRLSVTTAIQFYDLQDRLGVDQPSKAVEWLIKAAADAIAELPSLNSFPDTPKQLSDEQRLESVEVEMDGAGAEADPNNNSYQSQHLSLSKSACSSNSENSKNSGLSLSRPDIRVTRVKARERARERAGAAKDKEKEQESRIQHDQNNSSFTELLTCGIGSTVGNNNNNNNNRPPSSAQQNINNEFQKTVSARQWSAATPMDYFAAGGGLFGPSSSRGHHTSGFLGNSSLPQTMSMSIPPFNISSENHNQEMQHFSFVPDHLIPVPTTQPGPGAADYNLNFSISSGLSGFNRGTLQSNSPSLLPHLQRFSSAPIDGPSFFIGTPPAENHNHNHHQFPAGFDGRLHLYYGDASRNSDQKEKGKN